VVLREPRFCLPVILEASTALGVPLLTSTVILQGAYLPVDCLTCWQTHRLTNLPVDRWICRKSYM